MTDRPRAKRTPGVYPNAMRVLADVERSPDARDNFPTAIALLDFWERPWATRLRAFAERRLRLCWCAGLDVLEVDVRLPDASLPDLP